MAESPLQIRSYHVVFQMERRIHRVDRFRLPLPYGLPIRSIGYALAALLLVLIGQGLPVIGDVLNGMPMPMRLLLVPAGCAYALTRVNADGRNAHVVAVCWLRFLLAPKCVVAFRRADRHEVVRLGDFKMVGDALGSRRRRGVVRGPATIVVRHPFRSSRRGRTLNVIRDDTQLQGVGKRIVIPPNARAVLR